MILCGLVFLGFMLMPSSDARMRKKEENSLVAARKVCLACRQYSREHGGVYPASLDLLFPKYLQDRSALVSPLNPAEPVGYIYTFPGPRKTDSPNTIVLEDKFAPALAHNRLVVYANASAQPLAPGIQ